MGTSVETPWDKVYGDIEDLLAPMLKLDPWERVVYYHLLRHTRLEGRPSGLFAVGPLSKAIPVSDFKVREVIRSLHDKGCIRIDDKSRNGHLISVLLPSEIPGLVRAPTERESIDITSLDFFSGRRYVVEILARENGACLYCLKALTLETCELDHLVPQADKLDHSFRNVVASCHNCNKSKGSMSAADFVRKLYRSGILGENELVQRLATVEAIQSGASVPHVV